MKTTTFIVALGLTSAMLALDAAAKPGRPDALTRGISVNQAVPTTATGAQRNGVVVGRPEALTRGLGPNLEVPSSDIANRLSPEQKAGKPEYHTRGIYCPHRGKRS